MITADLKGRTVLVTGGASGIGLAAVELFAQCGAVIAMNHLAEDSRGPAEIERLIGAGRNVVSAPGNVSAPGEAERMVKSAIEKLGRLDVLINNAGTPATTEPIEFADLDAMTESFWQKILMTNLVGPFRCAHAAASALKASRGAIVNTASVAGLGVRGSSIAYGASNICATHPRTGQRRETRAHPHLRTGSIGPISGRLSPVGKCRRARLPRAISRRRRRPASRRSARVAVEFGARYADVLPESRGHSEAGLSGQPLWRVALRSPGRRPRHSAPGNPEPAAVAGSCR